MSDFVGENEKRQFEERVDVLEKQIKILYLVAKIIIICGLVSVNITALMFSALLVYPMITRAHKLDIELQQFKRLLADISNT